MAFGKRQLVLAALVVALGAAVYLNWQFSDNRDLWRDFLNFPYFTGFSAH